MPEDIRTNENVLNEERSRPNADDRDLHRTGNMDQPDKNPDPITGTPGAHPIGTGVGAVAGGAAAGAATGAVIGTFAGPIGTAVGTAIGTAVGAIAGGYAGKEVAESINPTEEDAYWRAKYRERPYVAPDSDYELYQGAYQYGWESRQQYQGRSWDDVKADLELGWAKTKHGTRMTWDHAKQAVRDAWEHISDKYSHHGDDKK